MSPSRCSRAAVPVLLALTLVLAALEPWLVPGAESATCRAYVGPGAGIALIGSFFAVFSAALSGIFFLVTYPLRLIWRTFRSGRRLARARTRRVVILGLDGLDPDLAERYMDAGHLPHLARLRAEGSYRRLGTSCPPLSPVAWSSFSTGTNPGKHNIFDFIARSRRDYRPLQSSVQIAPPRRHLRLGRWTIPLSPPRITGRRKSKPFWNVLGEAGIFSSVIRVPITFPPDRFRGVQLSAMCVPDLRGTHGTFSYFCEDAGPAPGAMPAAGADPGLDGAGDGRTGGDVVKVRRVGDEVRSVVRGPVNTLRRGAPDLEVPFRVRRAAGGAAILHIQNERIRLEPGRSSGWVRVSFRALGPIKVRGVCRFMLRSFDPFAMYCTPVQIDPDRPVMPIGHPRLYSRYLARLLGSYSTLGLAEDTSALSEGRIDEAAFLRQAYDIHDERERMYFDALKRVRRGLVTCVFDGPDRIQHMFWRFIDERHPARGAASANGDHAAHGQVIADLYRRMDDLVGRTRAAIDDDTVLFVMSDHGFKSFRRGVDLNAWLRAEGYLVLRDGAAASDRPYLADVDWSRTRAYALGLAGLYLNRRGREGQGIVSGADAPRLAAELCDRLSGLVDPGPDEVAIHRAHASTEVYRGPYVSEAPDVIVGYAAGYRVSWDAATGRTGTAIFSDNTRAWSGDHCVHPDLVPGVLFSTQKLREGDARIVDVAPTALDLFGVDRPAYMDGRSLLCDEAA